MHVIATDNDIDVLSKLGGMSKEVLIRLLNTSRNPILLFSPAGKLLYINKFGRDALGSINTDEMSQNDWVALWPGEHQTDILHAFNSAGSGNASSLTLLASTEPESARWWELSFEPVPAADMQIGAILVIAQDVTARQTMAENIEPQNLHLREIDHRVKNSLAMVAAVLRLQIKNTDDQSARADLEDAANRILTVSQVHAELYRTPSQKRVELADYISALAENLVAAMARTNVTLNLSCQPVYSDPQTAQALGLILTELVSNALRHAFPNGQSGSVSIALTPLNESQTRLIIADTGVGLPDTFDLKTEQNLGSKIILLYAAKIGATIKHLKAHDGAVFEITY